MSKRPPGHRAAIYARVSTDEQAHTGTSLAAQLDRCRSHADDSGWHIVGTFADEGISGALSSRPALNQILRLVEDGEVDVVVITKLDRIARSLRHLLDLLDLHERHDVQLVALDDTIDPSTASGRAMIHLRGVFAELERQLIRERTTEGLIRRVHEGGWPGGPPPYGYRIIDNPTSSGKILAINEDEAAIIKLAHRMITCDGYSTGEVAQELNRLGTQPRIAQRWTHWILRHLLLNGRGLSGSWPWRRAGRAGRSHSDEVNVSIPAILTQQEHENLLAMLAITSVNRSTTRAYLLSGRITSPHGIRMQGVPGNGDHRWYRCPHRHKNLAPQGATCDCRRLHAPTLEVAVWEQVSSILSNPDTLQALAIEQETSRAPHAQRERDHLATLDLEIARLEDTIATQAAELAMQGLDAGAIAATVRNLNTRLSTVRDERRTLERLRGKNLAATGLTRRLHILANQARTGLSNADAVTQAKVLDLLDVRIDVLGWETCTTCEGRGLLGAPRTSAGPKGNRGRTGTVCPSCLRTRNIPQIQIAGQLPEAVLMALTDNVAALSTLPPHLNTTPFRTIMHVA